MKFRSALRLLSAASLAVTFGLLAQPNEAKACGDSISFEVDPQVLLLSQAETELNGGKAKAAALTTMKVFPKIKTQTTAHHLLARGQRVVAMAIVRTDGFLTAGKDFQAASNDERRANLEWAVTTLRRLAAAKKNNPAAETDLAEGLAKLPETRSEALAVLEKLAKKDLVPSARAWSTLAKLRKANGDDTGYEAAMKKFEALTKTKRPAAPAPAKPSTIFST